MKITKSKNDRILVIGCSGSGKSTLTRELISILKLPALHLDRIWHTTNYDEEAQQLLKQAQLDFINDNECFIIDGNYSGTMNLRIPHANLIIWLRVPRSVSMYRVIMRTIKGKLGLEKRSDMAEEFKEKFDREYLEFLRFVWNFEKANIPKIKAALEKRNADCRLVIIKNKKDKAKLIKELVR